MKFILLFLLLSGCDYTIGIKPTTPAEKAGFAYISCANYYRINSNESFSDWKGCKGAKTSHCICAKWEEETREDLEAEENEN